jgi:hypothetical protein
MTSSSMKRQAAIVKEHVEEHQAGLRERMKERGHGTPLPPPCPSCGFVLCQCRCNPTCRYCGGIGYVHKYPEAKMGEKGYGQIETCPALREKEFKKSLADGESIGGLTAEEISTMSWKHVLPGISDAAVAMPFVKETLQRGYGLGLMFGLWGQGKTLLMKIAVASYIRQQKKAVYIKRGKLMDDIRMAYDTKEGKMTALVAKMREWEDVELLALDEIGADSDTEWAEARFFEIVDQRWVKAVRGQGITFFASNYAKPDEIPGYLRSRIEDSRFSILDAKGKPAAFSIFMNGPDARKAVPQGYMF